jgi:hypothetical protein
MRHWAGPGEVNHASTVCVVVNTAAREQRAAIMAEHTKQSIGFRSIGRLAAPIGGRAAGWPRGHAERLRYDPATRFWVVGDRVITASAASTSRWGFSQR